MHWYFTVDHLGNGIVKLLACEYCLPFYSPRKKRHLCLELLPFFFINCLLGRFSSISIRALRINGATEKRVRAVGLWGGFRQEHLIFPHLLIWLADSAETYTWEINEKELRAEREYNQGSYLHDNNTFWIYSQRSDFRFQVSEWTSNISVTSYIHQGFNFKMLQLTYHGYRMQTMDFNFRKFRSMIPNHFGFAFYWISPNWSANNYLFTANILSLKGRIIKYSSQSGRDGCKNLFFLFFKWELLIRSLCLSLISVSIYRLCLTKQAQFYTEQVNCD